MITLIALYMFILVLVTFAHFEFQKSLKIMFTRFECESTERLLFVFASFSPVLTRTGILLMDYLLPFYVLVSLHSIAFYVCDYINAHAWVFSKQCNKY